ncbi:hypothetical protein HMPREF9373_2020 [Psychrobacter sp. 1501(2011)]|nr:hypothetical protein HMPREF9373_2020 [Psychrobacter sp. 1501(2011)]
MLNSKAHSLTQTQPTWLCLITAIILITLAKCCFICQKLLIYTQSVYH